MGTIVPRWEWRAFGRNFGRAEEAFVALTPERVQMSDELYLVSPGGENVKVRDDVMDIKVLREVNDDGLEPSPAAGDEPPIAADHRVWVAANMVSSAGLSFC